MNSRCSGTCNITGANRCAHHLLTLQLGTYCGAGSTTAIALCPTGGYCPNPATRIPCPSNTFGKVAGATTQTAACPGSCPVNSGSLPGSTVLTNCTCILGFAGPRGGPCHCICNAAAQTCSSNCATCGTGTQTCTCYSSCVDPASPAAGCSKNYSQVGSTSCPNALQNYECQQKQTVAGQVCTSCKPNFYSGDCSRTCPNCNSGVCRSGISGDGSCNCTARGTTGQFCQFSDAVTCNGHGKANYDGSCTCNTGFAQPNCGTCQTDYANYPKCVFCPPYLCNGHGSCTDYGNCTCAATYDGAFCNRCENG